MRISLVAVGLCACTQARFATTSDSYSSDPAVYRAVLDSMSVPNERYRPSQLVVVDSTLTASLQEFFEPEKRAGVDSAAISEFQKRNVDSHSLRYLASPDLSVPVVLVSRQTLESFRHNGPEAYWSEFYRRYPGSSGSIAFSSIGYSADGNVAVMEVEQGCGTLCGTLSNVVVKRERGRWRVVLSRIIVIS